ncbi:hypothetical protein PI124_g10445 [Phytophthora idaei]|nr:hypothetical protein PI125_g7115 [Phytophthora idaei]KAG3128837.1 hypothetical protein PI126_g21213 [Phytophthora idaei]KAG3244800.1 hypothetical protein PI124_g10445 [Phytophthora idaei]
MIVCGVCCGTPFVWKSAKNAARLTGGRSVALAVGWIWVVGSRAAVPDKDEADGGTVDNTAALESDRERGNRGNAGSGATLASESLSELTKGTSGVAVACALRYHVSRWRLPRMVTQPPRQWVADSGSPSESAALPAQKTYSSAARRAGEPRSSIPPTSTVSSWRTPSLWRAGVDGRV